MVMVSGDDRSRQRWQVTANEIIHSQSHSILSATVSKRTHHFPGQSLIPEGGALLQAEQSAPYRCAEGSSYSSRSSRWHKIPLVPKVHEEHTTTVSAPSPLLSISDICVATIIPVAAKVGEIKFDLLESDALELKDVKKKKEKEEKRMMWMNRSKRDGS